MQKVLSGLGNVISVVTRSNAMFLFLMVVLLTVGVLPMGDNFLIDSKVVFLFATVWIVGLLWTLQIFQRKSLQITLSPFVLPTSLLLIAVLVSSFFSSTLPVVQLFGMGGVWIATLTLILIGPSLVNQKVAKNFLPVFILSAIVLAVAGVAEYFNAGPSRVANMLLSSSFPSSPVFSLAGSPLIAVQIFILALAGIAGTFIARREKTSPLLLAAAVPLLVGVGVYGYTLYNVSRGIFTGATQTSTGIQNAPTVLFLPYMPSISVAMDAVKSPKVALIGEGPESYLQSYLRLKPTSVNLSPAWNLQFNQGSNVPFTLIPTLGLIGTALWVFLFVQVLRHYRNVSDEVRPLATVALASFLIQLVLPPNVVILAIQALALLFWIVAEKNKLKDIQLHAFTVHVIKSGTEVQRVPQHSNLMAWVISVINAALLVFLGIWIGRYVVGQWYNFQANLAVIKNDLIKVYQNQQRMISANPYIPGYHRAYSLTNMSIAVAYSNAEGASEEQRQQAVVLVQQSIREARSAILLEPANSVNWVNMGRIYNYLIGAAEGADTWALDSYAQAQNLAINDPILSLEIGGLLLRFNRPADAVKVFERTVTLKPDWAPAYYNLAVAYFLNQELQRAVDAFKQTMALLPVDSQDYAKVKEELAKVEAQLDPSKKAATPPATTPATTQATPSPTPAASPSSLTPSTATSPATLSPQTRDALKNTDLENPQQ